jgi:hypothetical protein
MTDSRQGTRAVPDQTTCPQQLPLHVSLQASIVPANEMHAGVIHDHIHNHARQLGRLFLPPGASGCKLSWSTQQLLAVCVHLQQPAGIKKVYIRPCWADGMALTSHTHIHPRMQYLVELSSRRSWKLPKDSSKEKGIGIGPRRVWAWPTGLSTVLDMACSPHYASHGLLAMSCSDL